MRQRRNLSKFGLEVKSKLLIKGLTQKEFCQQQKIPYKYFTEILYGGKARVNSKYRKTIIKALQ